MQLRKLNRFDRGVGTSCEDRKTSDTLDPSRIALKYLHSDRALWTNTVDQSIFGPKIELFVLPTMVGGSCTY